MIKRLIAIDQWLEQFRWPLALLLLMVILRIPNLFEPYWYGDEGIYLAVANGMKQGSRLYAEIIDHKTPLIYYLALVPNQLTFRLLLIGWMAVTTTAFYNIARLFLKSTSGVVLTTAGFIVLTSVPWFEGNIPNGELFMMGFVLCGLWLFLHIDSIRAHLQLTPSKHQLPNMLVSRRPQWLAMASGFLLGLALLVKVPALFDAVAIGALGWFGFWNHRKEPLEYLKSIFSLYTSLIIGLILPIGLSLLYFWSRGSLSSYLEFGLLYNFHYAGNWQLTFDFPWLTQLFTLPSKFLLTSACILMFTWLGTKKYLNPRLQFALSWTMLALFASLLSNRPYPHYFLQLMPPIFLVIGLGASILTPTRQKSINSLLQRFSTLGSILIVGILVGATLFLLDVGLYPVGSYYRRFLQFATGQLSTAAYYQTFSSLMADNYQAAQIITSAGGQHTPLFIWGTNPTLYALTQTAPTGRFTVSFHIDDLQAYQETLNDLMADQPQFIVVMHQQHQRFPGFFEYLSTHYLPHTDFDHFTLWQRRDRSL